MNSNNVELVTIPRSEYDELVDRSDWLSYLVAAGVDNWDGYDYAIELRDMDNEH